MKLKGRMWRFDRDLVATDFFSSDYDKLGMSRKWDECAQRVLDKVDPNFVREVRDGDIIVSRSRTGAGHAHYYMPSVMATKLSGVGAVLSNDVNVLFQRLAIDQGFLVWAIPGIIDLGANGDDIQVDLTVGEARNLATGKRIGFSPVPDLILDIVRAGGSRNWAKARVAARAAA
jgi:3-isopropylmalate/(R)-2-methylmalate dehydratase small subunit